MSLNLYASSVGTKGYTSTSTAGTITRSIDGHSGKRLGIMAYNATPSESATSLYFMMTLQQSTIATTGGASGLTTLTCAAFASAPVTSAVLVIVLDDGSYQWLTVASTASTTSVPISSALTDDASAGAKVYDLGLYTTDGNYRVPLTASTNKADSAQTGLMYSNFKGAPARVHMHSTGSGTASINYVTFAYTNV